MLWDEGVKMTSPLSRDLSELCSRNVELLQVLVIQEEGMWVLPTDRQEAAWLSRH